MPTCLVDMFRVFFNKIEPIRLKEPLAQTLGAFKKDEVVLEYTFAETVKMTGHACPTVSAAYVGLRKAIEALYPGEIPVRGDISVVVYGEPDEGVYGVMAQVFSFIVGACASTGFKGLGYKFKRKDLLSFVSEKIDPRALCFGFSRADKKRKVLLKIYPQRLPSLGDREQRMGELLEKIIWEAAKDNEIKEFQDLWMEKVERIVLKEENVNDWLIVKEGEAKNAGSKDN